MFQNQNTFTRIRQQSSYRSKHNRQQGAERKKASKVQGTQQNALL